MTTIGKIQELFSSQLSCHAQEIARAIVEKHGDVEGLESTIQEYLATANLDVERAGTKTKGKTKPKEKTSATGPKTRKVVSAECRCQARLWPAKKDGGAEDGTDQCSMTAGPSGLCTRHAKSEAICNIPLTLDDNGHHKGLWHGRMSQMQEGEPEYPPYKDANNVVRLQMSYVAPSLKAYIQKELEAGKCQMPGSKKQGAKKMAQTAAAEELTSAMEHPSAGPSLQTDEPNTNEPALQVAEERATEKEELFGSSDEEDNGVEEPVQQPVAELVDSIESSTVKEPPAEAPAQEVDANDDEEEAPEVVEKIYEGALFYVEKDGTDIYHLGCEEDADEYGELIGQWVEGKPVLDEEWKHLLWKE